MKPVDYITGIQHIAVPTNDMEKTVAFYEALGFVQAFRTINKKSGNPVCFLKLKNICIETFQNGKAVGCAGAIDHIALDVSDIDAAFAAVQATGYTMLNDSVQFLPFWENGVKFFTIEGPNKEKVEFSQML